MSLVGLDVYFKDLCALILEEISRTFPNSVLPSLEVREARDAFVIWRKGFVGER
jgi:hypothetical protein